MDPDSVAANSTAADLDAYFPGHLERPSTSVRTELLHQRTRDIVESFTHDGVISTFQPVDLVQQRRDKLRQLKHISRLEHDLLQKNGQSEELREEIQELKVSCGGGDSALRPSMTDKYERS